MSRNTKIVGGFILALVIAAAGVFSGSNEPVRRRAPDQVLGTTIFRSTTTMLEGFGAEVAIEPTPLAPPASASVVVVPAPTPTTTARATATTARASSPTTRAASPARPPATTRTTAAVNGRPAAGTQVTETADNGGYFTYHDSTVTDSQITDARDPGFVQFSLSGSVVDGHGRTAFTVVNRSGGPIGFPGGVNVKITITRPDGTTRMYEVRDPSITQLTTDGSLEGRVDFGLISDGRYSYTGSVLVEYR